MKYSKLVSFLVGFAISAVVAHSALAAPTIETAAKQALVADATTGAVMFQKDAFSPMYPASMTKLMTTYIVFDRLKKGAIKMEDTLVVSEDAWKMGGSKMFVHVGDAVKLEDLIRGIIIQSGNDACVVVAEGLAGGEPQFAELMNQMAKAIGLEQSHFVNSTGWPDPAHVMSPHDLYLLSRALINNFPEYYPIFGEKDYTYNNIHQPNRNLLLNRTLGVDGLKTGHTEISGYGMVVSGVNPEDGRRLIVVVNGLASEKERADEAERLLVFGYRNFENKSLFKVGAPVVNAEVALGTSPTVPLVAAEEIMMTLPKGPIPDAKLTVTYTGPLVAPVAKGTQIGKLTITVPGSEPREVPLMTGADVEELSPLQRIVPAFRYFFL